MSSSFVYELIGYTASALVAISLMMSSVIRLRIINLSGALCFTIYGLLIQAYPVSVLNFFMVLANLYHIRKLLLTEAKLNLLEVLPESQYLAAFLRIHNQELKNLSIHSQLLCEHQFIFLILIDLTPIGLFIAEKYDKDLLLITTDFVLPGHSYFKVGKYLYLNEKHAFRNKGFQKVCIKPRTKKHEAELRRLGFEKKSSNGVNTYFYMNLK